MSASALPKRRQRPARCRRRTRRTVPVAIVGAGACGLTAALMLRDAGIDCVLLERDARPQGSTALSSGSSRRQARACSARRASTTAPAQFARDIQAKAHGTAAPHLVHGLRQAIGPAIDALEHRATACEFELLEGFLYPGHSVLRMHTLPRAHRRRADGRAAARRPLRAGIAVMTEALVRELWVRRRRVACVGVGYRRPDGRVERLACRCVLLACNGFGGNAAMVRELLPEMARRALRRPCRQRRQRHRLGPAARRAAGRPRRLPGPRLVGGAAGRADLLGADDGRRRPGQSRRDGASTTRPRATRKPRCTCSRSRAASPGTCSTIALLALGRTFPDFRRSARRPVRCEHAADALAALGRADRLRRWRCWPRTLGRHAPGAPYHAVKVTGALFHTQGGLDIDAQCRVLRDDGTPLPNLLAAGGAARGVSGNAVWGYLSGNGLLSAVAGGAIAARTAAASSRKERDMNLKQRLHRPARAAGAGHLRRAERAGRRAGRLRGALPVGRVDRLHPARPLRRRPDDLQRGRATRSSRITERVRAAGDRRRRHRLRQCAEHPAHGARASSAPARR